MSTLCFDRLLSGRSTKLVVGTAAGLVLLTAFGGSGSKNAGGVITAPTMSGMPSRGASASAGDAAVAPNHVVIKDFKFNPAVLHVKPGTTVTFTNTDEQPHTVVGSPFHSGVLAGGQASYTFTFRTAGTFPYLCSIHPYMHGSVVVG